MNTLKGFGSYNEIEMFDVLSSILRFEFDDKIKMTMDCFPANEDLTNARKELLIFLMQSKDKSELKELVTNNPLNGLIEQIDENYYEAMSNSCVIFSQLVVKIIEASEKCVEYLKYLKSNLPKTVPEKEKADQTKKVVKPKRNSAHKPATSPLSVASLSKYNYEQKADESLSEKDKSTTSQNGNSTTAVVKKEALVPKSTHDVQSINKKNKPIPGYEDALKNYKILGNHRIYQCQKCSYEANDKNNFRDHVLKHLNYKRRSLKFKCRYCDYYGANSFYLKKHERDNHKTVYNPRKVINSKNIHRCSKCPFAARTRVLLSVHTKNHQLKKDWYKCRYCDYYLEFFKKMSVHEVVHPEYEPINSEDKFNNCKICPYKTLKLLSFSIHMSNHIEKPDKVKCRYCNYYLSTVARIRDHEKLHSEFEDDRSMIQ